MVHPEAMRTTEERPVYRSHQQHPFRYEQRMHKPHNSIITVAVTRISPHDKAP